MKRITGILVFLALLGLTAIAQEVQITGTVTSVEDGSVLPGVSVVVKGTTTGTTTNVDGKYSINASPEATLVFSFIGMQSMEVQVGNQSVIDFAMEMDTKELEEVVVTALGISKSKKALGYSATEFKSEDFERVQVVNATQALQGRVAGVNISTNSGAPGASTNVLVRGLSSITQSNQPLYVIDGVPINNEHSSGSIEAATNATFTVDFGNAASDINPSDIKSINVLKGAAATSLYGSRAANGAIIIETKGGELNQGLKVNFSSSATFSNVGRLPYYQEKYGQGWSGVYNSQENGSWGPIMDGKERLTGNVVDNSQRIAPFEFQEDGIRDFYETGYSVNNAIAISGGGEKVAYYASYANTSQDGVVPTDADRLNRHNITFKANGGTDKTKISFSTAFTTKKISAVSTGQGDDAGGGKAIFQEMMQVPVNHYLPLYRDYNNKFDDLDNYFTAYGQNPYFIIGENGNDFNQNRIITSLDLSQELTKNLKIAWRGGLDHYSNFYKRWGAVANITPGTPNATANDVAGLTQEEGRTVSQLNSDLFLNFNGNVSVGSGNLEITAIVGNNINQRTNDRLTTISKGLVVPGYYNVKNISGSADVSTREEMRRSVGLFGTVSLNYNDFMFMELTGRNDWSSTLPLDKNSYFYPGVNASFLFSELLTNKNIISFGKLRLGYAFVGGDSKPYSIEPFYRPTITRNGGYGFTRYPVASNPAYEKYRQLGNPVLRNELTSEFEVGTYVTFLNNRIGLDLAYYNRVITDLIFDATIASSSGYDIQTTNLGQINNSGIELQLDLTPVKIGKFSWDITYIFTKENSIIDKLAPELGVAEYVINSAYETEFMAIPGEQLGVFRIPDYKRSPDGKIIVGDNGLPVEGDKRIIGSSVPDFKMSLSNTFSFKGVSLGFLVDYQKGGWMYSNTANSAFWGGNGEQTLTNDRHPWVIPNSVQEITDAVGNVTGYSENSTPVLNNWHEYYSSNTNKPIEENRLVEKTYIKLREVSLNYKLPNTLTKKAGITDASIGVFGTNLILWTPAANSFIDPEMSTFGNDIEALFGEFDGAPSVRSYGVKLSLSF